MEEKKYSFDGNVTIKTQEFYDLVCESASNKHEAELNLSKYYSEYSRAKELETRLKSNEEELKRLRAFVSSSDDRLASFKLFESGQETPDA